MFLRRNRPLAAKTREEEVKFLLECREIAKEHNRAQKRGATRGGLGDWDDVVYDPEKIRADRRKRMMEIAKNKRQLKKKLSD